MDREKFEKNAQMLLRYGMGKDIEGAREKVRALIRAHNGKEIKLGLEKCE